MNRWSPMGKLGATDRDTTATVIDMTAGAVPGTVANGPEDLTGWDAINWRAEEEQVRRLRQRIFKAVQAGDWKQARHLPRLMLRSRANTLVSVRQVSQRNTGRRTPGVDGQVALTSPDRAGLAMYLHRHRQPRTVLPVRKHSPGGRRVMDGAVLGRFYGEMACAGGCQGLPSMSWCRTWRAPWPCLRAVSM